MVPIITSLKKEKEKIYKTMPHDYWDKTELKNFN